jgi:septal ring factor EnvC (AmiA/AmiB activator)
MKDCQLPYGMQYHNELLKALEEAKKYYNETFKQQEQQAKEMEKQQKKNTKTMEKLIESNRKFDEKNNNSIKYNPNDRSEDNPNVTNFFI